MKKTLVFVIFILFGCAHPFTASATTVYLASGTTWTVPNDWNNSANTIEVIGGGGGGASMAQGGMGGGGGGGGGGYSKISNASLTTGVVIGYAVGAAGSADGAGGDTYLCNSTSNCASIAGSAVIVGAKGGGAAGGAGGAAASGVGTVKYSGGAGGALNYGGGGGGGAAGPHGAGNNGANGTFGSGGNGGSGDAGYGGSVGSGGAGDGGGYNGCCAGSPGGNGTEWDGSHGSGGGGGGSGYTCDPQPGGNAGSYGAGGGGVGATYDDCSAASGGAGTQGLIVITYTPYTPPPGLTFSSNVTINGDLNVTGSLSKSSGSFVIDHPLDPKNKLLYHSFVESPEVSNVYVGRARLDQKGSGSIRLPSYFLALNKDFKYFSTPIGVAMPNLFVSMEVRPEFLGLFGAPVFKISGGVPNGQVSWMVTGVRHDPYIEAHPVVPEVPKGPKAPYAQGVYIHPDLYAPSH